MARGYVAEGEVFVNLGNVNEDAVFKFMRANDQEYELSAFNNRYRRPLREDPDTPDYVELRHLRVSESRVGFTASREPTSTRGCGPDYEWRVDHSVSSSWWTRVFNTTVLVDED